MKWVASEILANEGEIFVIHGSRTVIHEKKANFTVESMLVKFLQMTVRSS